MHLTQLLYVTPALKNSLFAHQMRSPIIFFSQEEFCILAHQNYQPFFYVFSLAQKCHLFLIRRRPTTAWWVNVISWTQRILSTIKPFKASLRLSCAPTSITSHSGAFQSAVDHSAQATSHNMDNRCTRLFIWSVNWLRAGNNASYTKCECVLYSW